VPKIFNLIRITLLLALLLVTSACGGQTASQEDGALQGTITVSGAWALYPMMTRWAEEFEALHPGVQFDVSAGGAGKGMADALAGAADIGMVSRDVTPEEENKGAYWVAVTKDAVFPMVSTENPALAELQSQGLTRAVFEGIYITGEIKTWGQAVGKPEITAEIHVYTRSDAAGAPETWAKYLGKKQEDLLGIGVFGDPGLLEAVIKDPMGIGYNNLGYAYDNASGKPVTGGIPIPVDTNENGQADPEEVLETKAEAVEMVATGKYPSPPARALNLVTQGKPKGVVQAFIEWVLSDGQQLVGEAGYVTLTSEQLQASMQKVR